MARQRRHYGKWRIRWVDEHRERHSETFDTFEEAAFAQQKPELQVKEIKRGLRGSIQPNETVGDVCDDWLERRAPLTRSPKDDRSVIKKHIRPLQGDVRLRDASVGYADLLRAERSYLDPTTVHNILTLLIQALHGLARRDSRPTPPLPGLGALAEAAWRLGGSRGKPAGTRLEAAFMRAQVSIRCDLARQELGYRPVVTIDDGLVELARSRRGGAEPRQAGADRTAPLPGGVRRLAAPGDRSRLHRLTRTRGAHSIDPGSPGSAWQAGAPKPVHGPASRHRRHLDAGTAAPVGAHGRRSGLP